MNSIIQLSEAATKQVLEIVTDFCESEFIEGEDLEDVLDLIILGGFEEASSRDLFLIWDALGCNDQDIELLPEVISLQEYLGEVWVRKDAVPLNAI